LWKAFTYEEFFETSGREFGKRQQVVENERDNRLATATLGVEEDRSFRPWSDGIRHVEASESADITDMA
jgi:hypothetical protein